MSVFVFQGELFPVDSDFNSKKARKRRLQDVTKQSMKNKAKSTGGRPSKKMIGKRFGKLVIIAKTNKREYGSVLWLCRCDCGTELEAHTGAFTRKPRHAPLTHCGCVIGKPGSRGSGSRRIKHTNNQQIAFNSLLTNYQGAAASRGIHWKLSDLEFYELTRGNCYYCGVEPTQIHDKYPNSYVYNGTDRLDSGRGYEAGNCVSCCGICNMAKGSMSMGDFLEWVKRVYEFQARESE